METRSGPKHEDQGKEVRARCPDCGRLTTHLVVASAEYETDYKQGPHHSMTLWDEYQAIECKGCQAISFRHCSRNTEDMEIDYEEDEEILTETVKLYPEYKNARGRLSDVELLPSLVRGVYEETLSALDAGLRVLAGVGIRALVETVCNERGSQGSSLENRIDDLVRQGIITPSGAEILHGLRIMGNEAAHEVKPHAAEDLSTAIDVIEHSLVGVYILPAKTARLPRRQRGTETTQRG